MPHSGLARTILRCAAFAAIVVVVSAAAARATVVLPADLSDLVQGSTAIVHGRVTDVRAEWADGRRRIDSYVTVAVATYLKGSLGPTVTFKVPGGEMGAYRSIMVGAPTFSAGEEVILFLGSRGPSVPYVLGLSQGVFRVIADPATSGRLVVPPALVAGEGKVVRGDPARRTPTIEQFAADVRALMARPQGAR